MAISQIQYSLDCSQHEALRSGLELFHRNLLRRAAVFGTGLLARHDCHVGHAAGHLEQVAIAVGGSFELRRHLLDVSSRRDRHCCATGRLAFLRHATPHLLSPFFNLFPFQDSFPSLVPSAVGRYSSHFLQHFTVMVHESRSKDTL